MRFGAYVEPGFKDCTGPSHIEAVRAYETCLERTLDTDRLYYRWDSEFPTDELTNLIDGRIPHISFRAVKKDNTPISWASIAAGEEDERIREIAIELLPIAFISSKPLLITFNHEADNDRIGGDGYELGLADEFKQAWIRFFSILKEEGVLNIERVLILDHWAFKFADNWNPGGEWVDAWGVDGFNRPSKDGAWHQPRTLFNPALEYAVSQEKLLYITEFGTEAWPFNPDRRTRWIDKMGRWLINHEVDIGLAQYWNGLNYQLNEDTQAFEALKMLAHSV